MVFSSSDIEGIVIVNELSIDQHRVRRGRIGDVLELTTTLVQLLIHARQLVLRRLCPPRQTLHFLLQTLDVVPAQSQVDAFPGKLDVGLFQRGEEC